jgi:uncharacterized protein (TIGR02996 family)
MTAEETGFLAAIKKDATDATARGAYADWLDEHGRPYEALLQRGAAGLSEVYFKIRRKSDGLFSEGISHASIGKKWSTKGKLWRRLSDLRTHVRHSIEHHRRYRHYYQRAQKTGVLYNGDTPWNDLEVIVVEVRITIGATMPLAVRYDPKNTSREIEVTVTEPLGGDVKKQRK